MVLIPKIYKALVKTVLTFFIKAILEAFKTSSSSLLMFTSSYNLENFCVKLKIYFVKVAGSWVVNKLLIISGKAYKSFNILNSISFINL